VIENLKSEGIRVVDVASGLQNGGEIVERVMERMRGIEGIRNSLMMIRTHMESLQRHERYSIVIN
jgi:hypothetical protein